MAITVRGARPDDAAWIDARYDEISFRASDRRRDIIGIAEVDGERAGLARLVTVDPDDAELGGMYVLERFRGRGVAGALLRYLLTHVTLFHRVYCLPYVHLVDFYRGSGFVPCLEDGQVPRPVLEKLAWCRERYEPDVVLLVLPVSAGRSPLVASYDRVGAEYAREHGDEIDRKPFDQVRLDRFARLVGRAARVCDLGSGPGQGAARLRKNGVACVALDLSMGMLRAGRDRGLDAPRVRADFARLPFADGSLDGAIALYSLIHVPRPRLPAVLEETHRCLAPGGLFLLAVHEGAGAVSAEVWFESPVTMSAVLYDSGQLRRGLERAGFDIDGVWERKPYPFEFPSRRLYVLARASR